MILGSGSIRMNSLTQIGSAALHVRVSVNPQMFSLFQSAAVSPNPTIVSHLEKRSISGVLEIGKIKKILNILFHQNSKMFQEESN